MFNPATTTVQCGSMDCNPNVSFSSVPNAASLIKVLLLPCAPAHQFSASNRKKTYTSDRHFVSSINVSVAPTPLPQSPRSSSGRMTLPVGPVLFGLPPTYPLAREDLTTDSNKPGGFHHFFTGARKPLQTESSSCSVNLCSRTDWSTCSILM